MAKLLRFFPNSMGRQTFTLLFIGFIVIQAIGLAVFAV